MAADTELIHVVDGSGREHDISVAHIVSVLFTASGTHQATITRTTAGAGGSITVRGDHAAHVKRWLERRATKATTPAARPDLPEGSVTP